jgi:hypothetical protein
VVITWHQPNFHWLVVQVLHALGNVVAQQVGLTYTKHNLKDVANLVSLTDGVENDWRRLYI